MATSSSPIKANANIIVHFPIACWLLISTYNALYIWKGGQEWRICAELLLITGLISSLAAAVFGLFDIKRAQRYRQKLPAACDQHMTFVGSAWCVYVLSLGCRQQSDHKISLQSSAETTINLSTAGLSQQALALSLQASYWLLAPGSALN
ncbi:MAG: hypothetical protein COB61_005680 [Thiotrichales bacterium]|nr:hypothetical protein [Thiotrichales bacterium]